MGWLKWIEWLKTGVKDHTPNGIAKKISALFGGALVALGVVSAGTPAPTPVPLVSSYTLVSPDVAADATEGWLQRRMNGAKAWIGRHPAISGTVAGCVGGSFVPVVGTIFGCVSGATIGYTIGADEREEEKVETGGEEKPAE